MLGLVAGYFAVESRYVDGEPEQSRRQYLRKHDPAKGVLVYSRRGVVGTPGLEITQEPDAFGNILVHRAMDSGDPDMPVRETRRYYDAQGIFPTAIQNESGHITTMTFDPLVGRAKYVVDPNGLATSIEYDAFGRPISQSDWNGSVSLAYQHPTDSPWAGNGLVDVSPWAKLRVVTRVTGGEWVESDFDAFGREVLSRTKGYEDAWVTTAQAFDWRGNVTVASRPHEGTSSAPGVVTFAYDPMGRLLRENYPDSTFVQHGYVARGDGNAPWFTEPTALFAEWTSERTSVGSSATPETVGVSNVFGELVSTVDAEDTKTNFQYTAFGLLKHVEHVEGGATPETNFTRYEYDGFGRLELIDDPDTGIAEYEYDGFDQIRVAKDARDLVSTLDYDEQGRLVRRTDDWPDRDDEITEWAYDTAEHGIGRLHFTKSPDDVYEFREYFGSAEAHSGQVKATALVVDGETFRADFKYDSFQRLQTIRYPDVGGESFEAVNTYDNYGHLTRVDGAPGGIVAPSTVPALWQVEDVHQGYLVDRVALGGATTQSVEFNELTGRIEAISATDGASSFTQQLTYTYFKNGDLKSRENHLPASANKEQFGYDPLHRLLSVTRTQGDETSVREYRYGKTGNILRKDDENYNYNNWDKPHAVRDAGANDYDYDQVGNQIERVGPGIPGGLQRIEFNAFNLPRTVTTGPDGGDELTDFKYSADGARVLKRGSIHESVLFGGLYERVKEFGPTLQETHKYLIYAGGEMVAQIARTPDANGAGELKVAYLLKDNLGSVSSVVDDEGVPLRTSQEFEPFGSSRSPEFSDPGIRYGFTGHAHDEFIELIDMGGRMYDPQLGRFLSADPYVQSPGNLQSYNRYSYAWNSPLNIVDPSGFWNEGGPTPEDRARWATEDAARASAQASAQAAWGAWAYSTWSQAQGLTTPPSDPQPAAGATGPRASEAGGSQGQVGVPHAGPTGEMDASPPPSQPQGGAGADYLRGMAAAGADAGVGSGPDAQAPPASSGGVSPSSAGGAGLGGGSGRPGNPWSDWDRERLQNFRKAAEWASWAPGPIGMLGSGITVAFDLYEGNYTDAAWGVTGIFAGKAGTSVLRAAKNSKTLGKLMGEAGDAGSKLLGGVSGWLKGAGKQAGKHPGKGTPKDAWDIVNRRQGPKGISRIDKPNPKYPHSQWEAHTGGRGSPALLQDGTWKHGNKPGAWMPREALEFLKDYGWNILD